jgi:Protein of unknown function (DUF2892)
VNPLARELASLHMRQNLATWDRALRAVFAIVLGSCAVVAPLPLGISAAAGGTAIYLVLTALAGTCLGYRMLGRSTCPT